MGDKEGRGGEGGETREGRKIEVKTKGRKEGKHN